MTIANFKENLTISTHNLVSLWTHKLTNPSGWYMYYVWLIHILPDAGLETSALMSDFLNNNTAEHRNVTARKLTFEALATV